MAMQGVKPFSNPGKERAAVEARRRLVKRKTELPSRLAFQTCQQAAEGLQGLSHFRNTGIEQVVSDGAGAGRQPGLLEARLEIHIKHLAAADGDDVLAAVRF